MEGTPMTHASPTDQDRCAEADSRRRRRTLAAVGSAVTACAVAGSIFTKPDSAWYQSLRKPSFQPPAAAFPIVWTALYAAIAAATTKAITRLEEDGKVAEAEDLRRALTVNLVLNAGWSGLFFRSHNLPLATVGAAALAASSADLTRRAAPTGAWPTAALGAYTAWCTFATVLTGSIARLNPGSGRVGREKRR